MCMCVRVGLIFRHGDGLCVVVHSAGSQCDTSVCCRTGKTCFSFELTKSINHCYEKRVKRLALWFCSLSIVPIFLNLFLNDL